MVVKEEMDRWSFMGVCVCVCGRVCVIDSHCLAVVIIADVVDVVVVSSMSLPLSLSLSLTFVFDCCLPLPILASAVSVLSVLVGTT